MSKQYIRPNVNSKKSQTSQQVQTQSKKKNSGRARRRARRSQAMITQGRGLRIGERVRINRRELWGVLTVSTTDGYQKLSFDSTTGPAWFKKIAELYEYYQVHHVTIEVVPNAATTNSGNYTAAYNTQASQKSDARTASQIAAQFGSTTRTIYRKGSIVIPASALKNFRTNTPTQGTDSWSFDFEMYTTGVSSACAVSLFITYDVTFSNPQI